MRSTLRDTLDFENPKHDRDDAYARHTADYWRAFFNVPTLRVENPQHYGHRHYNLQPTAPDLCTPTPPSTTSSPPPSIATLAA